MQKKKNLRFLWQCHRPLYICSRDIKLPSPAEYTEYMQPLAGENAGRCADRNPRDAMPRFVWRRPVVSVLPVLAKSS